MVLSMKFLRCLVLNMMWVYTFERACGMATVCRACAPFRQLADPFGAELLMEIVFGLHRTPSYAIADASSRRLVYQSSWLCFIWLFMYEPIFENSLQKI